MKSSDNCSPFSTHLDTMCDIALRRINLVKNANALGLLKSDNEVVKKQLSNLSGEIDYLLKELF